MSNPEIEKQLAAWRTENGVPAATSGTQLALSNLLRGMALYFLIPMLGSCFFIVPFLFTLGQAHDSIVLIVAAIGLPFLILIGIGWAVKR